jgi:hypothetical protein
MNPFYDKSTAYEAGRRLANSAGCKLLDLVCHTQAGSGSLYLCLLDSHTAATAGAVDLEETSDETDQIGLTSAQSTWATGTQVRFTTTDTLPAPLAAATTYYLINTGDNATFKVATTLQNALVGTAIDLTSAGAGTHTANVLTWIQFPPKLITDGDTVGPAYCIEGREFAEGIYAVLSSSDTTITPAGAVGFFDAVYTR